jgi:cation transport regulator ChaC
VQERTLTAAVKMQQSSQLLRTQGEEGDEKMTGDQWYFAYGSNLFVDQKVERTGPIRKADRCRLAGFRFTFNKRGNKGQVYANIVPDKSAEVWGVVYLCNPQAIRDMNDYEGVASGHYERILVTVERESSAKIEAITYVAGEDFVCDPGKPSDEYLRKILAGACRHSLPRKYVEAIEALARGGCR